MAIKKRVNKNQSVDPSSIALLTYNNKSGAQKNAEVGRHLLPLQNSGTTYTTDATTAIKLPSAGKNLAVYNKSATAQAITLSEAAIAALGVGATDAAGHVGVACKPNDWTYIACGEMEWVIADSANLVVYLIDDDTLITTQATR